MADIGSVHLHHLAKLDADIGYKGNTDFGSSTQVESSNIHSGQPCSIKRALKTLRRTAHDFGLCCCRQGPIS